MAQTVKQLPVMKETWVWSLNWEHPLEEGIATHSVFLPGESPRTEEPGRANLKKKKWIKSLNIWIPSLAHIPFLFLTSFLSELARIQFDFLPPGGGANE